MWDIIARTAVLNVAALSDYLNLTGAPLSKAEASDSSLMTVFSIVIGIAGATAMLLIVIGGVKYMMSNGDPGATSKALKTILYSGFGLVVSILAFAIVQFVIGRI